MKLPLTLTLTLIATTAVLAQEAPAPKLDSKVEGAVRAALPVCSDLKMTVSELPYKLPNRFTGTIIRTESARPSCEGQWVSVVTPTGGHYLGAPWFLDQEEGATLEARLASFMYRNMQQTVTPTIERKADAHGLWPVTLVQTLEAGKMPLYGSIDPQGKVFFFGSFRRLDDDPRVTRVKAYEPFLATSPAKGPASAPVTIVEFSDFECPSCRRAAGYLDPILAKHGDKVRYIRYDVPLSGHPWAFAAALAGRAIHRQKPDLFWQYKKSVYDNQDKLNAFTFWDWARGWAQDHELNLEKYDADLNNAEIRKTILDGVGVAFSNDVRATPSYVVNGALVDAGDGGAALAAYVDSLLK